MKELTKEKLQALIDIFDDNELSYLAEMVNGELIKRHIIELEENK